MSAWVQLAAALGAGLAAGIMGIALTPFLEKLRLFEPEPKTKDTQHKDGQEDTAPVRRRPTMGGLLVLFGTLAGVVIGFSCFWSIVELKQQTKRVERGWFPKNPRRCCGENAERK